MNYEKELSPEVREKIIMQLFDGNGVFRIHSAGFTFEYQEPIK